MVTLTEKGRRELQSFLNTFCAVPPTSAENLFAWEDAIDAEGHLEIAGRFSKNGNPATTRFTGEELEA